MQNFENFGLRVILVNFRGLFAKWLVKYEFFGLFVQLYMYS
jgi:hypothetical protein